MERVPEGYSFPLNPAWALRDPAWLPVLRSLQNHRHSQECLDSWFPRESGVMDRMEEIVLKHPDGFGDKGHSRLVRAKSILLHEELDPEELAANAMLQLRRYEVLRK